jgi:ppGpp synthetase/RelA/SpoT-type nucleotidyltranferase
MNLSQVQDIAGMRLVQAMTLEEQDQLVDRLLAIFPGAKIIDRRTRPSFGYRAVHVVPKVDGRHIEVRVRTALQDRWAQMVERMADHWGRGIRYGQEPDRPAARVSGYTRSAVVELARRMSPLIEQCEMSSGVHGNRIQLSGDRFCVEVSELLSLFARLRVSSEEA